jgi:hypothetical protein
MRVDEVGDGWLEETLTELGMRLFSGSTLASFGFGHVVFRLICWRRFGSENLAGDELSLGPTACRSTVAS